MNEVAIIVSTIAIMFSLIALILGCVAISIVVGLKNSTHTIQWKPLDTTKEEDFADPLAEFEDEPLPSENPFKRKPKKPVKEDFDFMEDVTDQSNF